MKITITPKALAWFKEELEVPAGHGVRFFGKVYGKTQVHDGFSVGMSVEVPEKPIASTTVEGLLFFADEADELLVDYYDKLVEPKYGFTEE